MVLMSKELFERHARELRAEAERRRRRQRLADLELDLGPGLRNVPTEKLRGLLRSAAEQAAAEQAAAESTSATAST